MRNKVLFILVVAFIIIIGFNVHFYLIGEEWPYSSSYSGSDFNFNSINLILSLGLSVLIALIGIKTPIIFRFLIFVIFFPIVYFSFFYFFNDTLKAIDFGLAQELNIEKIVHSTDYHWVIHQLITEEKGTLFISQLDTSIWGHDPHILKGDTIKSIRIRESRTNPNHFYFYLKK